MAIRRPSQDLQRGYFSRLASLHLHLDWATHPDVAKDVLAQVDQAGLKRKISKIDQAVIGPQTAKSVEHRKIYDMHNPVSWEDARFDYFATIDLSGGVDLVGASAQ